MYEVGLLSNRLFRRGGYVEARRREADGEVRDRAEVDRLHAVFLQLNLAGCVAILLYLLCFLRYLAIVHSR